MVSADEVETNSGSRRVGGCHAPLLFRDFLSMKRNGRVRYLIDHFFVPYCLAFIERNMLLAEPEVAVWPMKILFKFYICPGTYSPCMQGMHCMPSHLAKKGNNNLNKYM